MSENAEWAFDGFVNSHNNPNRTLVELDLADMPISHNLFIKMALFFKNQNPAYESSYLNNIMETNDYEIEMEDESDLSDVSFRTEESVFLGRNEDLDISYIKRFSAGLSGCKMLDENNNMVESQKSSLIIIDFIDGLYREDLVKEFGQIVEFKKNNAKKCFKFDLVINKMLLWVYPDSYKRNFFKIFTEKNLVNYFSILENYKTTNNLALFDCFNFYFFKIHK